ncbi:CAIB/BAIF family protein [Minicystis rosea]|nr:CAIB/BAIF family protein [Minicystis rosea]
MLLADLGADVIKVERPGVGDDTREWKPPAWNGRSATFLSANRNKRGIAIDLDSADGQELVRRMARGVDVVVESFRPGSLRARGLDAAALRTASPQLVYCSSTAYGGRGPKSQLPGYDPVLQGPPPPELGLKQRNTELDYGTQRYRARGPLPVVAEVGAR